MVELLIGDASPAIVIERYLNGRRIDSEQPWRARVIILWATWCGSARETLLLVNDLQAEFPHVSFFAVAILEDGPHSAEKLVSEIELDYPVALDQPASHRVNGFRNEGWMARHWFLASYQDAVPVAFILDEKSLVAWVGQPQQIAANLQLVVDGTLGRATEEHRAHLLLNHVRERHRLRRAVIRWAAKGNHRAVVRLTDRAFFSCPPLAQEREFQLYRLRSLARLAGYEQNMILYAKQLVEGHMGDARLQLMILAALLDGPTLSAGGSEYALAILHNVKKHIASIKVSAADRLRREMYFVRAFARANQKEEALAHAAIAREISAHPEIPAALRSHVIKSVEKDLSQIAVGQ
jgi:thiol-disulfide isomerase/thioredoxin